MVASEAEDDVPKNLPLPTTGTAAAETEDKNTKLYYRQDVWMAMRKRSQNISGLSNHINRKIPYFSEAEVVAERLAETPEFQQAKTIKVNIDLAQESVKLQALKTGKTLFVAPSQKSDFLYAKIKPCNVDEVPFATQKRIVKMLGGEETYEELGIEHAEPLDMIVVGCVAVTEHGQRIGKGNGYVDLEIAILVDLGVITNRTVIATTVADEQVYGPLPAEMFQPYDFTIDLIVTPTRVIRVANRPDPRAIGVQWNLLSSRRLEVVRVLKKLKERLEAKGKHIELKDEDTDIESFRKTRNQRNQRGGGGGVGSGAAGGGSGGAVGAPGSGRWRQQNRRRRFRRSGGGAEGGEQKEGGGGGGGGGGKQQQQQQQQQQRQGGGDGSDEEAGGRMRRKRRFARKPLRYNRHDSEESIDHTTSYAGQGGDGGPRRGNQRNYRRKEHQLEAPPEVRIRVSNMSSVRYKDFKDELRSRDCYPSKISRGRYGKCVLIFPKRTDGTDEQAQVDSLLQKLANLRIAVQPDKEGGEPSTVELKCELQPSKQPGRPDEFDEHDDRANGKAGDSGPATGPAVSSVDGAPADANSEAAKASYNSPLKESASGGPQQQQQRLIY